MAGIARLAWRNLGRNRRRTAITSLALAIGVALSIGALGWMDGLIAELLHALTRNDLGHAQVHHPEYPRTRSSEYTVADPDRILATAEHTSGVLGAAPRVYSFALLSHDNTSLGVSLVGVDPNREPDVTVMHTRVIQGQYLDREATPWPRGRALTADELARDQALTERAEADVLAELDALEGLEDAEGDTPEQAPAQDMPSAPAPQDNALADEASERHLTENLALIQSPPPARPPRVLIGVGLARILHLQVGDQMHATGQTVDGNTEEVFFEVAGIFKTGTASFDRARIFLHITDLQRFMHLYDKVHEIALITDDPKGAGAIARKLAKEIDAATGPDAPTPDAPTLNAAGDPGSAAPLLWVRSWQEIRPDIKRMLDVSASSMLVMVFIIFFVAVLGVVNTMLMAVFERTREFGVLKALGMSGTRIVGLVVAEALLLVVMSALIGTLLGFGLDVYMAEVGIDLGSDSGFSIGGVGLQPVVRAAITARGLILPGVILALMSLLASLYPAIRAARLRPAVGMRET